MNPAVIKLIAALGVCILCAFGGGYVVNDHWEAKYNTEKLAMEAAKNKAILEKVAENDKLLAEQKANHAQEIKGYEDRKTKDTAEIARNRAALANGLYLPRSACNGSATGAKTADAGQSDGADQATFRIPERIETGLLDLVERADRKTSELENKLIMCQQFAYDNGFAVKPK
jgi:hypothetical protein